MLRTKTKVCINSTSSSFTFKQSFMFYFCNSIMANSNQP